MAYLSDLNDAEWEAISDLFSCGNYGKNRKHPIRALLNGVLYLNKTGCQWRFLPTDFPPWQTVYSFYARCQERGVWEELRHRLVGSSRLASGRDEAPHFALIDAQSVKTTQGSQARGYDGGKKSQRA